VKEVPVSSGFTLSPVAVAFASTATLQACLQQRLSLAGDPWLRRDEPFAGPLVHVPRHFRVDRMFYFEVLDENNGLRHRDCGVAGTMVRPATNRTSVNERLKFLR
jgi:hypothetical protein